MVRAPYERIQTRSQLELKLFFLVGVLGGAHFIIDGLGDFLPRPVVGTIRIVAGVFAGVGSALFEMYKARQQGW